MTQDEFFTELQLKHIMKQLLLTLHYFHAECGVVHRDVKLSNILISDTTNDLYTVKLADFGLATFCPQGTFIKGTCGTPGQVAPEVMKNEPYTTKCDIFSVGCVAFNLAAGRYLFYGDTVKEAIAANLKCDISLAWGYLEFRSEEFKHWLRQLLELIPTRRYDAFQALNHPWFNDCHQDI